MKICQLLEVDYALSKVLKVEKVIIVWPLILHGELNIAFKTDSSYFNEFCELICKMSPYVIQILYACFLKTNIII